MTEEQETERSVPSELLDICDELSELRDLLAFLADGVGTMVQEGEPLNYRVASGILRYGWLLTDRTSDLLERLNAIRDRAA